MPSASPADAKVGYDRQNLRLAALFIGLNLFQFLVLPAALLPISPWFLLLLAPLAFLSQPLWYLAHESFHSGLHSDRRVNERLGRALAVMHGAPFAVARLGHLMHHRFNRAPIDAPEVYHPRTESYAWAALHYYARLLGGLYLGEVLAYAAFFLPAERIRDGIGAVLAGDDPATAEMRKAFLAQLTTSEAVDQVREEACAFALMLFFSLVLYGRFWFMIPLMLLARGLIISLADNLPHYGTPLPATRWARNLSMPGWLSAAILHFNHHRIHHGNPTLPWQELPRALAEQGEVLETPYLEAGLAQLRGPIPIERMPTEVPPHGVAVAQPG